MTAQPEIFPEPTRNAEPRTGPAPGADTPMASNPRSLPIAVATPWGLLSLLAENLDDLERTRIAAENRARALAQVYGLDGEPPHRRAVALAEALAMLEHGAELELKRALRNHPLGPWVKNTIGVGEKQGARLLAAIGDPYWNTLHDRPRTVSELWAYCGYHVRLLDQSSSDTHGRNVEERKSSPAQTTHDTQSMAGGTSGGDTPVGVAAAHSRGQRANWSNAAKMRAFLIAESCMKVSASEYRAVYDDGRYHYADAVHRVECVRCGPKGKPAPVGSALNDGHKHARALRLVAKEMLKDLWQEAKRLHEQAAE